MVKNATLIERIVGALVFFIAFITFFLTMAPTVSFWDCGEYIATSYILGIPHPPGNPLYVLVGRLFTILFFWTEQVAFRTNLLSVITAAATAFFLHKIVVFSMKDWVGALDEYWKVATVNIAGFVGALFGVFNYTFWFSAVETSVYIPAILTIVLNVYVVLIWAKSKEPNRDRWLLLFAYLAFLGIGLHMMAMFALMPIFLYILLIDKTKRTDWRLWSVALLLGSVMYSMAMFFFVTPVLLVMTAIYSFAPNKEAKIIAPFAGGITLWALYRLLVVADHARGCGEFAHVMCQRCDDIQTIGLIALAIIVISIINGASNDKQSQPKWMFAFLVVLVSLIGFSVHAFIPIRSFLEPMIDKNHPVVEWENGRVEWDAFRGFLERRQYGTESMITRMFHRRGAWSTQFGIDEHMGYGGFHITQFFHFGESIDSDRTADQYNTILGESNPFKRGWILLIYLIPTFFMLWGWKYWYSRDKEKAIFFATLFLITTIAVVFYMNFADGTRAERFDYERWVQGGRQGAMPTVHREVRVRDYFFTPGFMFFGLWIGFAAGALLHKGFTSKRVGVRRRLTPILAVLFIASPAIPMSQNFNANNRSNDWIPYNYAFNLLMSVSKNGILFTAGDNDTFPLWFLQEAEGIRRDVRIVNLSLVNTPWYISQLVRLEPKIPMSFTLEQIQSGEITHSRNPFPNPTRYRLPQAGIEIMFPSARELPILRVQDLMVVNIIDANNWERPIYFSSTVGPDNFVGFGPFLQFQGMVNRVMPEPVNEETAINFERTRFLLNEVYQFKNLGDNSTPLSQTARRTMFNYSITFIQFAHALRVRANDQNAEIAVLENQKAEITDVEKTAELSKQIEQLREQRQSLIDEAINSMDRCVALFPWDERSRAFRHELLMEQGLYELALVRLEQALAIDPNNRRYIRWNEDLRRMLARRDG
ncbi:MAG: DUF2723 domain-containing protein [Chitinivibrionia bacterium]|nr:DUF2723 domain-containing protein [Chitinivibrionia bacterium]